MKEGKNQYAGLLSRQWDKPRAGEGPVMHEVPEQETAPRLKSPYVLEPGTRIAQSNQVDAMIASRPLSRPGVSTCR